MTARLVVKNNNQTIDNMKKILLVTVAMLSLAVQGQNREVTVQDIFDLQKCYVSYKSNGLQEKSIDIDGDIFNLMSERDYARENLLVSDKDELQKLCDKISYESVGIKGKFGSIVDWKSMSKLFGSRIQAEQASMSYMRDGTFQLMCHGISDQSHNSLDKVSLDGKEVDAARAAKIILKELEGYDIITNYTNRPLVVVIHACGVGGKSNDSFASKLSAYLTEKSPNIYVVAAPGKVYPSASTWPDYYERVVDNSGNVINWNCFHGGKYISEGEKNFDETVTKLQKAYSK